MTGKLYGFLCALLLLNTIVIADSQGAETKEVSVRIFSKYPLTHVSIDGKFLLGNTMDKVTHCSLGAKKNVVIGKCAASKIKTSLLYVHNRTESFTVTAKQLTRAYRGSLTIYAENGKLVLVNRVSVEDYLRGVVSPEMPFSQAEALKAQCVVSRSWLYKNRHRHENYDFCDLTHCQVYKGKSGETKPSLEAVEKTKGIVLTAPDGTPADVFYHSTCGGKTTNVIGLKTSPLLPAVPDSYCARSPHSRWEFFLLKSHAVKIFKKNITRIRVIKRDATGRALVLALNSGGAEFQMPAHEFRSAVGKSIGWNTIKSTWFDVSATAKSFVFKGKGLGNGAGLCQWGAYSMATSGKSYVAILSFYFPKLKASHATQN